MDFIQQPIPTIDQDEIDYKPVATQVNPDGTENLKEALAMPKQILLISLIAKEPAIFNPKHDDYRNTLKKDDKWMKISQRVGWTDRHCKNKWKAMRDQYCRELKRARTNPKAVIKWKYFQQLEFLRPYALYRNYRPKMSTRSQPPLQQDSQSQKEQESPDVKTDDLGLALKTESSWSSFNTASQMTECTDIASQIMDQISQSENTETIDEEPQDDEDDDPIHTFLNIESYFEKELITMIQSEDVLYNTQHPSYRNMKLKLEVWEEIARKLKKTVRQCRLKWKALRDQYMREHKRLLHMSNGKYLPRWKHYDALGFLEKFTRQKSYAASNVMGSQKPAIDISIEHLDQEQMVTPSTEEDQEMSQYILGDDDTSQIFADCGHSKQSAEEEQLVYPQKDPPIDAIAVEEATTDVQAAKDDNDEVGAFFRAIAMKIRKANMSAMAFTELQIDILRVITNALRNP